jgi:peptidyl-prolyl cis-trans isomerase B (cyclophilin B)
VRRILPLIVLLALAGCGSSDDKKTTSTKTSAAAQQSTTAGCKKVAKPRPKPDGELDRPSLKVGSARRATIVTNCGTIVIAFDRSEQPKTVASFASLARRGFFDNLTFHRIAQSPNGGDFVVQGGDPTGTGQGGPGYSVTERPPEDAQYTHGVVAMAKTEVEPPGTSGSQFFIVTAEDAGLPPDYAILGKVVSGDDAVKRIAATPADPRTQQPTQPVVIQKVTVSGS